MRTLAGLLALLTPAVALAGQPLRGTVVAADGKPAAGAAVWAAMYSPGPYPRVEAAAAADGTFTLDLDPGEWFVFAAKGTQGGELLERPVTVGTKPPEGVILRMEERGTFRGRLLDADTGKPLAGGKLYLDAGRVLTADAEGKFAVGGLERTHHEAFVVAPGRQRMRVLFDTTAKADTELDVRVPRAGKVVGTVVDAAGNPIPGAVVGRGSSGSYFSINALYVACGPDGSFEFDDAVPPDTPTRLSAYADGYQSAHWEGVSPPADGPPHELRFRMSRKPVLTDAPPKEGEKKLRVVTGTVISPRGRPTAGVVVQWGYRPHADAVTARTNAGGSFRLVVPDEDGAVAVLPGAMQPEFRPVPAGGDKQVEVVLRDGVTFKGKVTDDAGAPIAGVSVVPVIPSPEPGIGNPFWLTQSQVRTAADGTFTIRGVPEAARFDFLKRRLSDVRDRELKPEPADNKIVLQYGGALTGRVVGADGKPVRDFRILVNFPHNLGPDERPAGFFAGYCGMGLRFTSDDGSFVVTGVGAGDEYRVTAIAAGHGAAELNRVKAVPVNKLAAAAAAVLKAGPPVKLRVRAVEADDKPIADARVTLVNGEPALDTNFSWGYHDASWEDMARRRSGADGWSEFPALSFGGATVLVEAPGYGRVRRGWRDGQKEITVELAKEAVIAGEVRDMAGAPLGDFQVSVTNGGDQIGVTVGPAAKGRFRVDRLAPGQWTVTVSDTNHRRVLSAAVVVKAGETTDLKVTAKPGPDPKEP
jgi:sarcosine oxidase gamma subunit